MPQKLYTQIKNNKFIIIMHVLNVVNGGNHVTYKMVKH